MAYGKEVMIDLYGCDVETFTRESIRRFGLGLCKLVDMVPDNFHFWDYEDVQEGEIPYDQPHLLGISGVQFITTSNITIHTLQLVGECYINLFSCKEFKQHEAIKYAKDWFKAQHLEAMTVLRGRRSGCVTAIDDRSCMDCGLHGKCSGPRYIAESCEYHT